MKRHLLLSAIFLALSALTSVAGNFTDADVERALNRLDRELANSDRALERRTGRLDSLKHVAASIISRDTIAWLGNIMEIAKGYSSFNNDSALIYYTKGYDMARISADANPRSRKGELADSLALEFRLRRATYLALSGFVMDAINEYNDVDTVGMPRGLKATYYGCGRQMYYYISSFYANWLESYDYWNNRSLEAQRTLIPLLPQDSSEYLLNTGELYYKIHEYERARTVLTRLIAQSDPETQQYAIATSLMASIALIRGDRNEYLYYLIQSAISDSRRATLDITSLQRLAEELYANGDTRRAHNYVSVALNNAVDSRASIRMMKTTELLAMVEADYNRHIARTNTIIYIFIAILLLCLLAVVISIFFLRRQLHRVARMKQELQEAGNAKDIYIGQFLSLCSVYMDKLKQFGKLVNRKISAGQVDDLAKIVKSGKFVEEQSVEFYRIFDDAFLHMYPGFVEKVNSLLRPEEQIVLSEGEQLNTDMRILAFMRLGIDDTNRVAQILNLSVNTIYAYRNRLRNRAIDRNTFEQQIMSIDNAPRPE